MRIALILLILLLYASQLYSEDKDKASSEPIYTTIGTSEKKNLTSFSNDEQTKKIIKRHKIEDEGRFLAKQGLYEEAIAKFKAAMDPSLINYEHEKSTAKWSIEKIYKRQEKFEQALQMVEDKLKSLPPQVANDNIFTGNDWLNRERLELIAMIKARDIKNKAPIYEYIGHIRTRSKYAKLIPPKGYIVSESDSRIDDLIHLYDYLHDYDSGIAFMDEIIKYHTQHPDKNHRSAHAKDVREYTRVKQAWELDKKTGQHGHLQEVIRTSDVISW
jgi:hypothetical protein